MEAHNVEESDGRRRRRRPLHGRLPSNRGAGPGPGRGRPRSGRRSESGSGTVLGLAIVLVIIGCMAAMCAVGSALAVRERVVVTSDLAALAAASTQAGLADGVPCERASEVAVRAQVELTDCTVIGDDVLVTVAGNAAGIPLSARSRAGPAPDDVDDAEPTSLGSRFREMNPQREVDIGRCDAARCTAADATGDTRPWSEGNSGR